MTTGACNPVSYCELGEWLHEDIHRDGTVYRLPEEMSGEFATPERIG